MTDQLTSITTSKNDIAFSFSDPNWRHFPRSQSDKLGLVANELYYNKSAKAGALVCSASSRSEKIAVSQSGLNYLAAAVERGDSITSGQVVFSEYWEKGRSAIIIHMDVADVVAKLKGIAPREGKYGPFFLFYRDGTPEEAEEAPF
jgi:hypothetical protein